MYYNMHINPTYLVLITVEPKVIKTIETKNTLMYPCNFNLKKSDTYCFIDCNLVKNAQNTNTNCVLICR